MKKSILAVSMVTALVFGFMSCVQGISELDYNAEKDASHKPCPQDKEGG